MSTNYFSDYFKNCVKSGQQKKKFIKFFYNFDVVLFVILMLLEKQKLKISFIKKVYEKEEHHIITPIFITIFSFCSKKEIME